MCSDTLKELKMKSALLECITVQCQQSFPPLKSLFSLYEFANTNNDKQQSPSLYPLHKYRAPASILSCLNLSRRAAWAPATAIKSSSRTFDGLSSQGRLSTPAKDGTEKFQRMKHFSLKTLSTSGLCATGSPNTRGRCVEVLWTASERVSIWPRAWWDPRPR